MSIIFGKNLLKLGIVRLSKNNISLKIWDGGSSNLALQVDNKHWQEVVAQQYQ
jgi:hypothetical protein